MVLHLLIDGTNVPSYIITPKEGTLFAATSRNTTAPFVGTSMIMAATQAPAAQSAMIHAIGGSLGSSLALLMFYPLERSRIELQARAAETSPGSTTIVDAPAVSSLPHHYTSTNDRNTTTALDLDVDEFFSAIATAAAATSSSPSTALSPPTMDDIDVASQTSWSMQSAATSEEENADNEQGDTTKKISDVMENADVEIMATRHESPRKKSGIVRCILDLAAAGELYTGVAPIIATTFTSQFIFFFMHAFLKRFLMEHGGRLFRPANGTGSTTALLSLTASCMAGIANVLLTNPLWVTNMAIVNSKTKTQNIFRELLHLLRTRGVRHLWDGTGASILLVSNPIIQFFCYEQFKQARLASLVAAAAKRAPSVPNSVDASCTSYMGYLASRWFGYMRSSSSNSDDSSRITSQMVAKLELRALETFLLAALAKAIATVLTYPLQLAQTLLRMGDDSNRHKKCGDDEKLQPTYEYQQSRYQGTRDCLLKLYQTKGVEAWYTGMEAKLLQTVLTAAFTFLTYEQVLGAVQTVWMKEIMMTRATRTHPQKG